MSILSTAELRKPLVIASALREFAQGGYHGTTIADVARDSKISPAYVFKLFPSKERLFVATLENCFDRVLQALSDGADKATGQDAASILDAMGGAYAELISDRTLILVQVHAQSVATIPEVGHGLRAGLERVTRFAQSRSGASNDDVQRFLAYGQLCHLIVTAGVVDLTDDWADVISHGIRHP